MRFISVVSTFFNVILSQSDPVSFSSNIGSAARAGEVVNIEILASMEDQCIFILFINYRRPISN